MNPSDIDRISFSDVEVIRCPFPTYDVLQKERPIHRDPVTDCYEVTRYDDLRASQSRPHSFR